MDSDARADRLSQIFTMWTALAGHVDVRADEAHNAAAWKSTPSSAATA